MASSRFYEDIRLGDPLPTIEKPVDLVHMVMYQAATWDFHRSHYDHEWVRGLNLPAPIVDGPQIAAYLAQLVVDWAGGDPGALRALTIRYRELVHPGDHLSCFGNVSKKGANETQHWVECELFVVNSEKRHVVQSATAVVDVGTREGQLGEDSSNHESLS